MNGIQLQSSLRAGHNVYGTLVVSSSPHWVGTLVDRIGIDFVFIDTEHIPIDRQTLAWMCKAYGAKGFAPLVRILGPDPYLAHMALDGGAAGVIAPYVEEVSQVRDLVGAVKYKPLKGRRLAEALDDPSSLEPELRDYLARQNAGKSVIVNIESVPAMDNLDDILDVDGLDAILIGPHDLSCSLGIPEQYSDLRFIQAVDEIVTKAKAKGVAAGLHAISPKVSENHARWAKLGANLIIHSADVLAACDKLAADISAMRQSLGDSRDEAEKGSVNI